MNFLKEHTTAVALIGIALVGLAAGEAWTNRDLLDNWQGFLILLPDLSAWRYLKSGLGTALLALGFAALYLVVAWVVGAVYRLAADATRGRPVGEFTIEVLVFSLFLATALLPVSMIMYSDGFSALPALDRYFSTLLLINGLLFFIGASYMDHLISEGHKTYAATAEFRSQRRANALSESSLHFLVTRFASVYYFAITFTLVPEIMEPGARYLLKDWLGTDIVLSLFRTALQEGLASIRLLIQLCAFVATALAVRLVVIESLVHVVEHRLGMRHAIR